MRTHQSIVYQNYSVFILASILVLAFDILGIVFAVKSSKCKESPTISKYLSIIGIVAFIIMFLMFMLGLSGTLASLVGVKIN